MMSVEVPVVLSAAWGSPRPSAWVTASAMAWGQAARVTTLLWVPWVAISGSQARPVVIMAWRCRRIAAAITVWAWVGLSLLVSLVVRCRYRAA